MDVETVRQRHEDRLMRLPNVIGVGIGERDGTEIIKVFVTHKADQASLPPDEVIPDSLDGVPIEVEEIGEVKAQ